MQALRLLVSFALLLAIPAQGIAAATGSLCMALGGHGEAAQHSHEGEAHGDSHDHDSGGDGGPHSNCGPCVACCASASIAGRAADPLPVGIASAPLAPSSPAPETLRPHALDRPPLAA